MIEEKELIELRNVTLCRGFGDYDRDTILALIENSLMLWKIVRSFEKPDQDYGHKLLDDDSP